MITNRFIERLKGIVGPDHVSMERAARTVYSYDASLAQGVPGAVVFPGETAEVSALVRAAAAEGVPFVPRGYGTNLSGGSIAPQGGLIICLSRFNRILAIEPRRRRAVVQPGVPNLDLQNALAPLGYFYAPDPASQKVATLGGNSAENSGGPRCLKYGVTTNHILGLEVVLPDGEAVHLGGPGGDAPGLDLRGLMIGSEGTFGLVTALTVRILPKSEKVVTMLVIYDSLAAAAHSVSDIIAAGIVPAALEMMDQPVMHAVEDSFPCGYPRDAAAVLIIEVEGPAAGLPTQIGRIHEICQGRGCREIREARNDDERDRLWAGRRGAFGAVARVAPRYLVADCTVPRNRLPEALQQVADISRRHGLKVGNVFHAGDGNLHPLLLFDPRLPGQQENVHQAGWEVMQACVNLGGTITGEHGVGLEKKEAMRLVFSEDDLTLMQALKQAVDPENKLNPGKILPDYLEPFKPPEPPVYDWDAVSEIKPVDEQEAAAAVRRAFLDKQVLRPLGSGLGRDVHRLSRPDLITLGTEKLDRIIKYDPDNQVITVEAGVTLSRLQEVLADNKQWLPLRPPRWRKRTLGGVAAMGAWGPERLAYGAPRDVLLGLRFISGQGRLISGGGQVVKNVAGYDLTRLLTGSAGTLGLITRLTFRVSQRPDICLALTAAGRLDQCRCAADGLLAAPVEPTYITARPAPSDENGSNIWRLKVGLEGLADSVDARSDRVRTILEQEGLGRLDSREYNYLPGPWEEEFEDIYGADYVLRADLPLDRVLDLAGLILQEDGDPALLADLGCGRILAGMTSLTSDFRQKLEESVADSGGFALLDKTPVDFKEEVDILGLPRAERLLESRIRKAIDPEGVFSPERWEALGFEFSPKKQ